MAATATDRLVLAGFRAGWWVVARLPEPVARAGFRVAADVLWRRRGRPVRRLEANLRRVVGPDASEPALRRLSRAGMRSYLRYWCDVFRLPVWPPGRVLGGARAVGDVAGFDTAVATSSGTIYALAHMGNWDHAGAWAALRGAGVVTVAERLRPEGLYDRFVAYRSSIGLDVLPLTRSRDTLEALVAAVRAGKMVCLLADRDLQGGGVEVDFFGARARMPGGPAVLALRTGAPLAAVTVTYEPRGIVIHFHEPVPVPASGTTRERVTAMTQALATAFEAGVRADPQDWHMLQRVWVDDPAAP